MQTDHEKRIQRIAELFAPRKQVEAIALGGSLRSSTTDADSDIDMYIYWNEPIPVETRANLMEQMGGASRADLGLTFWGDGDEWYDKATGIEIDLVYFDAHWMEAQVHRVAFEHQASMGYTTCFWYTVRHSSNLYDPSGWFHRLQSNTQIEYPPELRQNIIELNYPVLRDIIPSYANQIKKAVKRRDLVSINHRIAAFLASYFDILFALNHQLHPGEKRLLEKAQMLCDSVPENMVVDVQMLLESGSQGKANTNQFVEQLVDRLDVILTR